MREKSDFNQLVPASGLFVEGTQLKPVVGKQFVCRSLPLFLVPSVHAFDFFGVVVKVSVFWANLPTEVISYPNTLASVGVGYEKRIACVTLANGYRLDCDSLVGVDVNCVVISLPFLVWLMIMILLLIMARHAESMKNGGTPRTCRQTHVRR